MMDFLKSINPISLIGSQIAGPLGYIGAQKAQGKDVNFWDAVGSAGMGSGYLASKAAQKIVAPDGTVQYLDEEGRPAYPEYQAAYDPNTMAMEPYTRNLAAGINLNTQGLDRYRGEALRSGPSAWSGLAGAGQDLQSIQAKNAAAQQSAGQTARAQAELASKGGLSSGAAANIQKQAGQNLLDMNQTINAQRQGGLLDIAKTDEQNRIQRLGQLPGMELQALQPQFQKVNMLNMAKENDVKNSIGEGNNRNQFNLGRYGEQMKGYAADKTGDAIAGSKNKP